MRAAANRIPDDSGRQKQRDPAGSQQSFGLQIQLQKLGSDGSDPPCRQSKDHQFGKVDGQHGSQQRSKERNSHSFCHKKSSSATGRKSHGFHESNLCKPLSDT